MANERNTNNQQSTMRTINISYEGETIWNVIFGWDKFNSIIWISLIISFIIWSLLYFLLYQDNISPTTEAPTNHSHHGHGL